MDDSARDGAARAPEGKAPIYPGPTSPKLKILIPPSRSPAWWDSLAKDVLAFYAAERGPFVWPEAEYALSETPWVHDHCDPTFPVAWRIQTHHLKNARSALRGVLLPSSETLNRRKVTAWVLSSSIEQRGSKTRTLALAGAKRRAYRTFLGWTGDVRLCGAVGETVVAEVLDDLRGSRVWLPPGMIAGRVAELQGRPITVGGPIDAAGEWPLDPARLAAGAIPFAVEVKNVQSTLFPYDHDVWDLLAKLAGFPDVVPVFVARRLHWTTFRMFKDLGVLGTETRTQFFSTAINEAEFERVTGMLGFRNAVFYDGTRPRGLVTLFSDTGPKMGLERLDRWRQAAPIVANYPELRDDGLDQGSRSEAFRDFADDLNGAGLYAGGWAPVFEEEDDDPQWDDW